MTVETNKRGSVQLMHPSCFEPTYSCPIVKESREVPGTLLVGSHRLDQQEVLDFMKHLQRWLDSGRL